jgi:hypothetical protein
VTEAWSALRVGFEVMNAREPLKDSRIATGAT